MPPTKSPDLGRTAALLAEKLRNRIRSGKASVRGFLATERQLAEAHDVDRKTVRRALKSLEAQGLIETVRRRGYRVRPAAHDPVRGCPLAYVPDQLHNVGPAQPFHAQLLESVRQAAGRRGWALLAESCEGRAAAETVARLRAGRAFGVLVESADADLVTGIRNWGVPAVQINMHQPDSGLDAVMQDGYRGGVLAAEHLCARGCRRIAWFGPASSDSHAMERLGGALAGLTNAGRPMPPELMVRAALADLVSSARELLSRKDRPDGIIALWRGCAVALREAASELGLAVGRDFALVGWCPEEIYDADFRSAFAGGPVPPAVTWSVRTMAETAIARLVERRENPELPALLVKIPVRLKEGT